MAKAIEIEDYKGILKMCFRKVLLDDSTFTTWNDMIDSLGIEETENLRKLIKFPANISETVTDNIKLEELN